MQNDALMHSEGLNGLKRLSLCLLGYLSVVKVTTYTMLDQYQIIYTQTKK